MWLSRRGVRREATEKHQNAADIFIWTHLPLRSHVRGAYLTLSKSKTKLKWTNDKCSLKYIQLFFCILGWLWNQPLLLFCAMFCVRKAYFVLHVLANENKNDKPQFKTKPETLLHFLFFYFFLPFILFGCVAINVQVKQQKHLLCPTRRHWLFWSLDVQADIASFCSF